MSFNQLYYQIKPILPRSFQLHLRRLMIRFRHNGYHSVWPIDNASRHPKDKFHGWPDGKKFALVITHDVDTEKGQHTCEELSRLDADMGFKSAFFFVPGRYSVRDDVRRSIVSRGFEVGVHGLYHDGKLFRNRKTFQNRARKINEILHQWKAVGFRAPAVHHNLDWIHDLAIEYDASTFDTDPFEPQPDGVGTIFPFWVPAVHPGGTGYVELPYTLPQDFTLFVLMGEKKIDTWKRKIDWIAENNGMVLINAHPDYMNFNAAEPGKEEYPAEYYTALLTYIKEKYSNQYWHALPREMAGFWRNSTLCKTHR